MKLTIFTPTYNRREELKGLYGSIAAAALKMRKDDSVEWIIVDDGSEIDIQSTVRTFAKVPGMSMLYYKKENGGKHTAFNMAIEKACGDLFVCIDDDDRLTPDALSELFVLGRRYGEKGYGGFVGRVVDVNGNLLGESVFRKSLVSSTIEIRDRYHFWGEPEVFFTDLLKEYRFDVFEGEKFLTEAYVFDRMSTVHPFVYTNVPLMIKKFLPGGLTDNQLKIRIESPRGAEAYYYQRKQLSIGVKPKLKAAINRRRFARYSLRIPERETDLYELAAIPIAFLISVLDKRIYYRNKKHE